MTTNGHDAYATLYRAMDHLTWREREIVRLRFGLSADDPNAGQEFFGVTYTLAECARIFMVSRGRVSQIQKKALDKLRRRWPNFVLDP